MRDNFLKNFFDLSRFTGSASKIVKFCSSDFTLLNDHDPVDLGRMDGERSFDADTERQTSHGKGLAYPAVTFGDDDPFKRLQSFLRTFDDLNEHFNGVADIELGNVGFKIFFIDLIDNTFHLTYLRIY